MCIRDRATAVQYPEQGRHYDPPHTWAGIFGIIGITFPEEQGKFVFREEIWRFRMELRHLFRWNEVGIHISQPEQIPGELPQRGHSVIQSPGLSFVLVKETVCTLFVWQVKMRIPFFHMALVVFQIPLRCIIDITKAPFVRNETIDLFSDRCLSHSPSPVSYTHLQVHR